MFSLRPTTPTQLIAALSAVIASAHILAGEQPTGSSYKQSALIAPPNAYLEEVTVSAARQSQPLAELPYAAYHIDKRSLENTRNLVEALAQQPGVMVQKTANGQGSPFIRGFTGYRTLALIDGIRYNNSVYRDGPNEYFGLIDSRSLSGLELVNGPASVLYGSDAIGGTINLHSQGSSFREQDGQFWGLEQNLRWASAENSLLSHSQIDIGEGGQWGLLAGLSLKKFGQVEAADLGPLPTTGYGERAYNVRYDQQLNEQWQITAVSQNLKQDDVWRSHSTIYSRPFAGTQSGSDLRRLKDQQRRFSYIKLSGEPTITGVEQLELTVSRQQWLEFGERKKANGESILEFFDSRMNGIDLQLLSHIGDSELVYGADYYQDRVDSGRREFNSDGSLNSVRIQGPVGDDSRFSQLGIFAQWQIPMGEQWQWQLGSRFSEVRASIGRYEDPQTSASTALAQQWQDVSNSAKLRFSPLDKNYQAWFGLSQAFRAPNIADLSRFGKSRSNETEIAAPGLEPEYFLTAELGWRWQKENTQLQLNGFYTDIKDYISSTPTGRVIDGLTEVSKANSATGKMYGLESRGHWAFNSQWQLEATLSWIEGELRLPNKDQAEPFSRSMPISGNIQLQYTFQDSDVSLEYIHARKAKRLSTADQQDSERIPPGGTPAYSVLNLRSRHQLSSALELQFDLLNIADEAYRSHGSGVNEPGRGWVLGLKLAL